MANNSTELVFILDKSGSMAGLETDTIGGFNALLKKQKGEEGNATVTTVLFNHQSELLHDRIPINSVSPITEREYEVGGTTALLDAIGSTIQKIGNAQKRTREEDRADQVMFVITTDGMENASCEFDYRKIKEMIARQKEEYCWEFIFMGANIDAVKTASEFGIDEDFAVNYHADEKGTELNYKVMSETITSFRKGQELDRSWKEDIEKDFIKRKRK
ncbi:vWA domain-containing protein [Planococcus shixiaomingii]|uniref:vWA domain-containing protein n=1 Tax=Planococcus shixiaomingii TaxID=3058393 RepID=UPI002603DF4D|nr:vWA domain-containing protein [Planococcus sp. N022]WKA53125.1 VWA domain-containing protein [Planococcus sp. N022]